MIFNYIIVVIMIKYLKLVYFSDTMHYVDTNLLEAIDQKRNSLSNSSLSPSVRRYLAFEANTHSDRIELVGIKRMMRRKEK